MTERKIRFRLGTTELMRWEHLVSPSLEYSDSGSGTVRTVTIARELDQVRAALEALDEMLLTRTATRAATRARSQLRTDEVILTREAAAAESERRRQPPKGWRELWRDPEKIVWEHPDGFTLEARRQAAGRHFTTTATGERQWANDRDWLIAWRNPKGRREVFVGRALGSGVTGGARTEDVAETMWALARTAERWDDVVPDRRPELRDASGQTGLDVGAPSYHRGAPIRSGWARLSDPADKLGARYRHRSGWEVRHVGHPTAIHPYLASAPSGDVYVDTSGSGFNDLERAMSAVELAAVELDGREGQQPTNMVIYELVVDPATAPPEEIAGMLHLPQTRALIKADSTKGLRRTSAAAASLHELGLVEERGRRWRTTPRGADVVRTIATSIRAELKGRRAPEETYNIVPALRVAARALAIFPAANARQWREHFETQSLGFEAEAQATPETRLPELFADPLAAVLATWIAEVQRTPAAGGRALTDYARRAARYIEGAQGALGLGLDAPPSPLELRRETLGAVADVGKTPLEEVAKAGVGRWLAGRR